MVKKLLCTLIIAFFLINTLAAQAATTTTTSVTNIKVTINGKSVSFPDDKPYLHNNVIAVAPIGVVAENLGFKTTYDPKTKLTTFTSDLTKVVFKVGENTAIVTELGTNISTQKKYGLKSFSKGKRTYATYSFINLCLDASASYDAKSKTLVIKTRDKTLDIPIDPKCGLTKQQILALRNYPDNIGSNIPINANTGKPQSSYLNNTQYLKVHGLKDARMSVGIAKGHLEAFNNVDYSTDFEQAYREKEKKYLNPQSYDSLVNKNINTIKKYKIKVEGKFLSDPSLVYINHGGAIRVKGTMRYIVYSCTDVERVFGKGVPINKWIEEDCEVELHTLTVGKWDYFYAKVITLSSAPRLINGVK